MKHPGGRPTKYKPRYCTEIVKFFDIPPTVEVPVQKVSIKGEPYTTSELRPNPLPTFEMFAYRIGVDNGTIVNWTRTHPEFLGAYKKAKDLQKNFLIQNGIAGIYNPTFTIFTAKNITDMRDIQSVQHSSDPENPPILKIIEEKPDRTEDS